MHGPAFCGGRERGPDRELPVGRGGGREQQGLKEQDRADVRGLQGQPRGCGRAGGGPSGRPGAPGRFWIERFDVRCEWGERKLLPPPPQPRRLPGRAQQGRPHGADLRHSEPPGGGCQDPARAGSRPSRVQRHRHRGTTLGRKEGGRGVLRRHSGEGGRRGRPKRQGRHTTHVRRRLRPRRRPQPRGDGLPPAFRRRPQRQRRGPFFSADVRGPQRCQGERLAAAVIWGESRSQE
mmetsp:Transcript_557/g.1721  ORF Transcript_557/g.1721 Transcript_557/m.1721 type:complete len:235 (+) Transcript_557:504-1208(+)